MKNSFIIVLLIFSFSCKKGDPQSKSLSPANGTYLMTIHAKGIAGSRGGTNFDSTYSDYLTITGTWDSINVECPNIENSLYVVYLNSEDSLNYYKPWPPPGSGYSGSLYYSKLTHKVYLSVGHSNPGLPHYGSTQYTLTQQ